MVSEILEPNNIAGISSAEQAETEHRDELNAAHRPPEGRAGHRAGVKDTE